MLKTDGTCRLTANRKQVGMLGSLGENHRCLPSPGMPLGYLLTSGHSN